MSESKFIEINQDTGEPISPEMQEKGWVISSSIKEISEEEYREYVRYYRDNGKCKHHLIEDTPVGDYYQRHCIICNKDLGLI